jgi:PIN domain
MNLTYILIDFENVHPPAADMNLIRGADYRVRIFHGPHQNRFDADMVKALQPLGAQVEYVQCERKGKNALDFHMAFYLGRLVQEFEAAAAPPGRRAAFFIVSKDSGFDTLLNHVRSLGYGAERVATITDALAFSEERVIVDAQKPAAKTRALAKRAATEEAVVPTKKVSAVKVTPGKKVAKAVAPSPQKAAKPDPWIRTLTNLRDHPNNRPTTIEALERHLGTMLGSGTTKAVVKKVYERLVREGVIVTNGNKIEYRIPEDDEKGA